MTAERIASRSFSCSIPRRYFRIRPRGPSCQWVPACQPSWQPCVGKPAVLPAADEPAAMRKLRAEHQSRMLGNGYCSRPVDLDCHYETICESCTFFVTTIEFRPTLQRQRDDAAGKGQLGRQKIFDAILDRLDTDAS